MKRKRRRNIGWLKDLAAILIFLLLFPYFALSFKQQKEEFMGKESDSGEKQILEMYEQLSELPHNGNYYVLGEDNGVSLKLPIEHYLVGALAASISVEYEEEVLKAQTVILRSSLMEEYENSEKMQDGTREILPDERGGRYWTDAEMQSRWGKQYEQNLEKCLNAVMQTQGIYLTYKGESIKGYYHGMSAGGTRNANELSEGERCSYLKQTSCPENLSAADYLTELQISKKEAGELTDAQVNAEGYVLSACKDGVRISGEKLREELGIMSSNFTWDEEGDDYVFLIKGQGHGFGLDQYYGNMLAQKGMSYPEIIDYFFDDVVYQRME